MQGALYCIGCSLAGFNYFTHVVCLMIYDIEHRYWICLLVLLFIILGHREMPPRIKVPRITPKYTVYGEYCLVYLFFKKSPLKKNLKNLTKVQTHTHWII